MTYRYDIAAESLGDYRQTTLADAVLTLDPDGYETETREQGDAIAARHGWTLTEREYHYATDAESGTIHAASYQAACDALDAMLTDEAIADGAWGWVEDVDGERYHRGERG